MRPALAKPEATQKPNARRWRLAALAAATVALTACGASAAETTAMPTPTTTSGPGAAPATPNPAAADVGIVNFKFSPAALNVKVGTTVVWTNKDSIAHSVNFTAGGINSKVLNQNDQFTYTFTTPGTYDYICAIHPFMHGSITVTA